MYLKLLRRFLRGIFMVGCYNRILNLRGIRPLLWIAESFQWETKKLCIFLTHCSWFAVERFSKFFSLKWKSIASSSLRLRNMQSVELIIGLRVKCWSIPQSQLVFLLSE